MACMCGDTHCWSCGPAQGNSKCELCGSWTDDIAEMFEEEGMPDGDDFVLAHEQWHINKDGGPETILAFAEAEQEESKMYAEDLRGGRHHGH